MIKWPWTLSAQKLALAYNADRPVIDVQFRAESAADLGRMIHMGEMSALMAARLAGAKPLESKLPELDRRLRETTREYVDEVKQPDMIQDGKLIETQNILSVGEDGRLEGVMGHKIQEALDTGARRLFEYTVKSFARMASESVLKKDHRRHSR